MGFTIFLVIRSLHEYVIPSIFKLPRSPLKIVKQLNLSKHFEVFLNGITVTYISAA